MLAKAPFLGFFALLVLSVALPLHAATVSSQRSGAWNASTTWTGGIVPADNDDVVISGVDSVWLDSSTAPLHSIIVSGKLSVGKDTLKFNASPLDTAVRVFGTLDMGGGWFAWAAPVVPRPVVQIVKAALFRMSAEIPFDSASMFDSLLSPIFQCDDSSTFEYYSDQLDLIDVSYLANSLAGHSYANLTLTAMNASFRSNPVRIRGTLTIGFGASIIASAKMPGVRGFDNQQITISGDVVNLNQGESGSAGAGLHGGGMQSTGSDEWIFDRFSGNGKDTCRWSGPAAVGVATVRNNTVLAIRYDDATHCDSMDVLTRLQEENPPCGGHLLGKVYSEFATNFSASNPVDNFSGLGITIASGTPYLGRTRVVRVSGYQPPGMRDEIHPARRYYIITPGNSPQVSPNEVTVSLHCDELGYGHPDKLHFWRSRDRGATWAFSGITSYDMVNSRYSWDTTVLGMPNDSGGFYWALAEGYMDHATPADLVGFFANRDASGTRLSWQTASEVNVAGFELRSHDSLVASFLKDSDLRSKSRFGANYLYRDQHGSSERYDLYEISNDGLEELLASRWVKPKVEEDLSIVVRDGSLYVLGTGVDALTLYDLLGRSLASSYENALKLPEGVASGVYLLSAEIGTKRPIVRKIVLP